LKSSIGVASLLGSWKYPPSLTDLSFSIQLLSWVKSEDAIAAMRFFIRKICWSCFSLSNSFEKGRRALSLNRQILHQGGPICSI
jgi:hypothetical protein